MNTNLDEVCEIDEIVEDQETHLRVSKPSTLKVSTLSVRLKRKFYSGCPVTKFDSGDFYRGMIYREQSSPKSIINSNNATHTDKSVDDLETLLQDQAEFGKRKENLKKKNLLLKTSAGNIRIRTHYDSAEYGMALDTVNKQYQEGSITLDCYNQKVSGIYSKNLCLKAIIVNPVSRVNGTSRQE